MKKQKVPKEKSPKKSYLEWYKAREPFKVSLKRLIIPIVSLIACIFIADSVCEYFIGDALYLYSDNTYEYIESAVMQYTTSISEEAAFGTETYKLQPSIDEITLHWDKKTGTNTLECSIRNGFFNAVVTTRMSATFDIDSDPESETYSFSRNYTCFEDYKQFYWRVFKGCTFGGGIGVWLLGIFGYNGILFALAKIAKKKQGKADAHETADSPNATNNLSKGTPDAQQKVHTTEIHQPSPPLAEFQNTPAMSVSHEGQVPA